MIDNESGKKENWEEYQLPDGRQLELCMGDIILQGVLIIIFHK